MAKKTTNLGLIVAIWVSNTAPTNTKLIWYDTSLSQPIHKYYNLSTESWEPFIYSTLIDNVTIKKNENDELYVDTSEISQLNIADGSIALIKLADVASGTVFYRKSAGSGKPEVQTLAQLKSDLGLSGTNSGDQDLSGYVLRTLTINGKPLTSDISLTSSDIGAPSGSGTSTGTNTGDETLESILSKLGLSEISGINTGDQNASGVPITDEDEIFEAENVEDALKELKESIDSVSGAIKKIPVKLPSGKSVQERVENAVEGTDYPTGWVLTASGTDLIIEHNLGEDVSNITVFSYVDSTTTQMKMGSAAYTGIYNYESNSVKIQSLATVETDIIVNLFF